MSAQTVWITGASSGIGEALALQYARAGAGLVLSARREAELQRVANRCVEAGLPQDHILVLPLDVTEWDSLPGAVAAVMDRFGAVDVLINNAGLSQRSLCKDTDLSVYQKLLDVDVMGQIALTKAVLPHMLERGSGHLAVTASVAGKVGVPLRTGYCAAKHAVMGFYDALRAEVEGDGLHVSTIVPGFIRTDISRNALAADGSAFGELDDNIAAGMDVDECAEVIFKGLQSRKREIPVGKGKEMSALWLKRLAPEVLFRVTRSMK
ncbi:oxidoreductase, short-chain dehydrogenase/reductase family [Marinobacter nitratireducens]|uniref:Oxidoreductase, short-chain dehydrogenase/reductase family n=1 Tax=Marinobacter nitratireducens TaxID=1137280 RepID=A0A072N1G8_9GAMM|nr:SDR family oxidoreductase [Marinobacter nitratireducens]KEF31361.1 oxidoreductase, short-chain dehydrogenase/reductase family [Marinobacter nitratireducens]